MAAEGRFGAAGSVRLLAGGHRGAEGGSPSRHGCRDRHERDQPAGPVRAHRVAGGRAGDVAGYAGHRCLRHRGEPRVDRFRGRVFAEGLDQQPVVRGADPDQSAVRRGRHDQG